MAAADVRGQLATALGDTYRVERELGGGGMSRVFVAHDEKLGRDVVAKVLSPLLAEGLSAERFAREIRLAAALQDPHIVPVLAAGATADGLPYYTMPFVRGESLRARLAQGRIPTAEGVGILRDVATALEYAHARGIVHRDIKPENVLLSGRTAVVTDFGIAKALHASRTVAPGGTADAGTLTQAGSSLGTPAYMAPEQAAGDPATDHRADLYAWGVVAYEVLGGRHPFAGRTSPQQLLAAHMAETPPPLDIAAGAAGGAAGHGITPALAAVVMRCLAKDPAERPASAADVLASLDEAREGAIRAAGAPSRRTIVRAFALYAASFIGVAIIARVAIDVIGLPDWVLPGALVVMALGLPVLLLTGFVHHESHHRSPEIPHSRAGSFAQRIVPHLTWRRAATGGFATLGIFVLVVAGYMAMRVLGIGPAGSLLAAGVLEGRERLIVADFDVSGPDTALGPVVAEAVRANLGQSSAISIVPVSELIEVLKRMQRPAGGRFVDTLAREVAQRQGVSAVVGGNLTPLGSGYLVTLRLVKPNGDEMASFRRTAEAPSDLIPTLDRLTRDLRGKIGESLKAVRDDPPLEEVTTPSLDALRKYSVAYHTLLAGNNSTAAALAREAIAIDSTFAMAWRVLGMALANASLPGPERDSAFTRAYRHRDRLTERERLFATGGYFEWGPRRDLRRAAEAYEALIERDSTDYPALNNLAGVLMNFREFARAEVLLRRTAETLPRYAVYYNLCIVQQGQGKAAAAESTAALILRLFPEADNAVSSTVYVALERFEFDSAAALATRWRTAARTPAARSIPTSILTVIARARGRLADARRLTGESSALATATGGRSLPVVDSLNAAREDLWVRRRPERALERIDALVNSPAFAEFDGADRRDLLLSAAQIYAAAGRADRARPLVAEVMAGSDTVELRTRYRDLRLTEAEIALAERRVPEAIAAFRSSDRRADGNPTTYCIVCFLPGVARASELAGMADSARVAWESFLTDPSVRLASMDQWFVAIAYRRLGELYAAKGDSAKAADYDRRFLALWKDADPELQPQVAAVRQHLAQLRQPATTAASR